MKNRISRGVSKMVAIAAVLAFVAACSLELPGGGAPPRMFILTPKSTFATDLPKVDWQLLVEVPQSPAGTNTTRVALRDSPIEMRYFERANWTDLAPKMIQTLLVESFENSGRIVAVGREAIGLRADYILKTELREFQAEFSQRLPSETEGGLGDAPPPIVRVRINAKLIKMPRRSIIASQNFEHIVDVPVNSMDAIIGGFDEGLGKVMKQLVGWVLKNGETHDDPKSKAARRR